MVNWSGLKTVLLDMDGTVLDLYFDNYFWLTAIPEQYAKLHQISIDESKAIILARYQKVKGQLAWYCLEHWTQELCLDIVELKKEYRHLIREADAALPFMRLLKRAGLHVMLVTNAHRDSLALKLAHTSIESYVDVIVSAHDFGLPKEEPQFWQALYRHAPFSKRETLWNHELNCGCKA